MSPKTKHPKPLAPGPTNLVDIVNARLMEVGDGSAADLTGVVLRALAVWAKNDNTAAEWFHWSDFVSLANEVAPETAELFAPLDE